MEKVVGGSAEAFWQQGFPGLHFDIQDEAEIDDQPLAELQTQIEDYVHKMTRVLRTQGVDVSTLQAQVSDPSKVVSVMFDFLAGATGIPKRILVGSERGELASTQDETKWAKKIKWRRNQHANSLILDPFISRLIEYKILPKAPSGWEYVWPDTHAPSDAEKAAVGKTKAETLKAYADSPNAELIYPQRQFLTDIMEVTEEQIEEIKFAQEQLEKDLSDEQKQIDLEMRQGATNDE